MAADAQTLYGSLTGNVTDGTGAGAPAAKVEALNTATNVLRQTATDDHGSFVFSDLLPGTYRVAISAPAFGTRVTDGVEIDLNTVRRLDAVLAVSQVNEMVTVAASAVTLQTDRADVNHQSGESSHRPPADQHA